MRAHHDSLDRTRRSRKAIRFAKQSAPGLIPIVLGHGEIINHAGLAARSVNGWGIDQSRNHEAAKDAGILGD